MRFPPESVQCHSVLFGGLSWLRNKVGVVVLSHSERSVGISAAYWRPADEPVPFRTRSTAWARSAATTDPARPRQAISSVFINFMSCSLLFIRELLDYPVLQLYESEFGSTFRSRAPSCDGRLR